GVRLAALGILGFRQLRVRGLPRPAGHGAGALRFSLWHFSSDGRSATPSLAGRSAPPSHPRYRSSGGIRTEPSSVGFRTMESAFSMSVFATKIWLFPPLDFCFLPDLSASSLRPCLGLFGGLDALPFVCRRCPPHAQISQPKFMR